MKLTLGYSPCPNDTFIFDALVNKKIDTEGLMFDAVLEDVETLNQWAYEGRLEITKLSFPAFFQNTDKYVLLSTGAALGEGAGPLLISNNEQAMADEEVNRCTIALPGENTTANFLFSFAYPQARKKIYIRFDAIEDALLNGNADLGVIIHENRFTYRQKGLHLVKDLGAYWCEKNRAEGDKKNLPVPLGGIAIKNTIDRAIGLKTERLIRKSIEFAFAHYPVISDYVKQHAQSMSEVVMRQHIELYVNDFSLNLGDDGKKSIETFYGIALDHFPAKDDQLSGSLFLS